MPKPPVKSGMKPVLPTNTIPAGKYGQYVCADSSHGVEKGPHNVFRVLCLSNGSYQVPTEKDWPVCYTKTTTVSPGWCFTGTSWCFKSMKNLLRFQPLRWRWRQYLAVIGENWRPDTTFTWVWKKGDPSQMCRNTIGGWRSPCPLS